MIDARDPRYGMPLPDVSDEEVERWYAAFDSVAGLRADTIGTKRAIYETFLEALEGKSMSDKIDEAVKAVEKLPVEPPMNSMVAQVTLARNDGIIRLVVPRDFNESDFPVAVEMALRLLAAAQEQRQREAHGGLVLPDKKLVRPS